MSAPEDEDRYSPRIVIRPGGDILEGTSYRAIEQLAIGGMGEVFEAEHKALGHRVVAKVLLQGLAERPDMRDRMRIEAQALARIRHPNLVLVTDCGETRGGHPFIIMERLVGCSLRERIAHDGRLERAEAVEIARQMMLGLHAVHRAGIVHRDVKPENVFLSATEDGRPYARILDFGVAKVLDAGRDPRTPLPLVTPTLEGLLIGTPRYFSPEQARREGVLDPRTDIYSAGLVLYEMLTGRGPFDDATSVDALCRAHVLEMPLPPSAVLGDPGLSPLDRVVLRALAKRKEDRYPDAGAFAEELGLFLLSLGLSDEWFEAPRPHFASMPDTRGIADAATTPDLPFDVTSLGDASGTFVDSRSRQLASDAASWK
ncbi:MAG: serine/threonine-protein kinase [Polyangiaceae bacterium]